MADYGGAPLDCSAGAPARHTPPRLHLGLYRAKRSRQISHVLLVELKWLTTLDAQRRCINVIAAQTLVARHDVLGGTLLVTEAGGQVKIAAVPGQGPDNVWEIGRAHV